MRGGQWQALRLIVALADEGVESALLARGGSPLFETARAAGIARRGAGSGANGCGWRARTIWFTPTMRAHIPLPLAALADPLVVSRRVAFPVRSRRKYRRAARFIAVSRFVEAALIAGGVRRRKKSR